MKTQTNYGLIPLKKSSNSNATHIFVNGFMSDHIEEIKALDWQKGIKKYTNPSDCKYIFHWDSGLDYTRFKTYLPFSNGILSELERATRQFVSKTRRYFEEDGKKPTLDTVRDKYAAFVPHVMLYPKGVVVEYNEVDKKRIR